ncbi:hypothetical protein LOK49_LG02G00882 [Camellia lanceoleosa]|uniref:Uncharacterized protein n=1 Tax=Camellia lanceoleosa TaxID=1840588 RepID=A0ACC0IU36_9ERIC|nr:hypothetical protein LOK49_LG02G00882 [Camellia lanceoleosa]
MSSFASFFIYYSAGEDLQDLLFVDYYQFHEKCMTSCLWSVLFFEMHYVDLSSKPFFNGLVEYIISGPVVAMVWEGKNVVTTGRKIIGATNPFDSTPGTIRGDFAVEIGRILEPALSVRTLKGGLFKRTSPRLYKGLMILLAWLALPVAVFLALHCQQMVHLNSDFKKGGGL